MKQMENAPKEMWILFMFDEKKIKYEVYLPSLGSFSHLWTL